MTPAASSPKTRPITPFRLTPTDEEMLFSCDRYQYMTREFAKSLGKRVPKRFRLIDVKSLNPRLLALSEDLTDVLLRFDLLAKHGCPDHSDGDAA
jgi:hypothetical protein